jgi:hypothetical protein
MAFMSSTRPRAEPCTRSTAHFLAVGRDVVKAVYCGFGAAPRLLLADTFILESSQAFYPAVSSCSSSLEYC